MENFCGSALLINCSFGAVLGTAILQQECDPSQVFDLNMEENIIGIIIKSWRFFFQMCGFVGCLNLCEFTDNH